MGGLRILIADGSSVYKKVFTKAVSEIDGSCVVTHAADGDAAYESIQKHNYDIIIIDAEITGKNAGGLLETIIKTLPKALILMTARPSASGRVHFTQAAQTNIVDYFVKPVYSSYEENANIVKNKMEELYHIISERQKNESAPLAPPPKVNVGEACGNGFKPEIVLIASSTGGPPALEKIFSGLGGDYPAPILLVQHMPPNFTENMTRHLNNKTGLRVKVAESDELIEAGTVYAAPGGRHMKLGKGNRILLDDSPPVNGLRPSADTLFKSVAQNFSGERALTVILTGMGRDGEKGLAFLKGSLDCCCITQSEKTCAVYGMPRAVVESGLSDRILDLDDIAREMGVFIKVD